MRGFIQFAVVMACVVSVIGCSDAVSPVLVDGQGKTVNGGQIAQKVDVFIEIEDIDSEVEKLEEAMDLNSGTNTPTLALLVPAVQKVREAMAELQEGAGRDGLVNAEDAEKTFRQLINTFKPKGDAYSIKEICNTSAAGKHGHKEEIEILSFGNNDPANVEYYLYHMFNGVRLIMDEARVNDDAINRAMDNVLASIADLSDERP